MRKIKVWIDPDWSPGGVPWDLDRAGMAKVYASQDMKTWVGAWLVLDRSPQKKNKNKARKKNLDK
jgi:hypothetical protein